MKRVCSFFGLAIVWLAACGTPDDASKPIASSSSVLSWREPISDGTLGCRPDDSVLDVSIEDFVSSRAIVRADGKRCSSCHFEGSGRAYSPPVEQGSSREIAPDEIIGGRTWAGAGGWGERFIATSKPVPLRSVLGKWKADGFR